MPLEAGTQLGRYEIRELLGAGGMGEVYRARDSQLDRDVAVKVLPTKVAVSASALERFKREARAVAALEHPNILAIYDFGVDDGLAWAAMELLHGQTLRERLTAGPIPPRKAVELARQLAEGLGAAHDRGIFHRDVKPDNVFVNDSGQVKVLDFGLASDGAPALADCDTTAPTRAQLTEAGMVMGTVGYMAPEQVRGEATDHRSDVFSFGCVLYEMLTGQRAFERDNAVETMTAILHDEPPDLAARTGLVPPALERVVRRCLEKNPAERFQSSNDLSFAIVNSTTVTSTSAKPIADSSVDRAASGRSTLRAALLAATGLAALVAALFLVLKPTDLSFERSAVRFEVPPPPDSRFGVGIALSPDGSQLAFVAPGPEGEDLLWVRPLSALVPRPLAGTEGAMLPFWSPDGERIAFFAKGKLKVVASAGGDVQSLCRAPGPEGGDWSRDGVLLLATHSGGRIVRVPATGGEPELVISGAKVPVHSPSFLPDGARFLYKRSSVGVLAARLDSESHGEMILSEFHSTARYAAPGYLVYRQGEDLMAQRFDAESLRLDGQPVQIANDVRWNPLGSSTTAFTVSESGSLAYLTGGVVQRQLLWTDRSGTLLKSLGAPGLYFEPAISPGGGQVAVSKLHFGDEPLVDIWTFDIERGAQARLTSAPDFETNPLWSPNGTHILYSTFPTGKVHRKVASGAGSAELLFTTPSFAGVADWESDQSLLLHVVDFERNGADIWRRPLGDDGTLEPVLAGPFREARPQLSPDGSLLAYETDETGFAEVVVVSYPELDQRWPVSSGGGTQPKWRGDGRELYFIAPDRKIMAVEIETSPRLEIGLPQALFATQIAPFGGGRNHYDVRSDGQRFLVNSRRPEDATLPIVVVIDWASGFSE